MILRLIVLVSLLVLGAPSERELKAEVLPQACKSTVTGTLEIQFGCFHEAVPGALPL